MVENKLKSLISSKNFYVLIFLIFLISMVLSPFYHIYITKKISIDTPVDPEYINGLITVSSILFGFSSLLVFQKQRNDRIFWYILTFPLFFIGLTGGSIWNVVTGLHKPMMAFIYAWISLNVNAAVTWFLVGGRSSIKNNNLINDN